MLSSNVGEAIDGDDNEIPVAALNSVVDFSFLLLAVVVLNLSDDDGVVANNRVDVLVSRLHPPQSISVCCALECENCCRLELGMKAVAKS